MFPLISLGEEINVAVKRCLQVDNISISDKRSTKDIIEINLAKSQMIAEARLVSNFTHENIVKIYGVACNSPPVKVYIFIYVFIYTHLNNCYISYKFSFLPKSNQLIYIWNNFNWYFRVWEIWNFINLKWKLTGKFIL